MTLLSWSHWIEHVKSKVGLIKEATAGVCSSPSHKPDAILLEKDKKKKKMDKDQTILIKHVKQLILDCAVFVFLYTNVSNILFHAKKCWL